MVSIANGTIKYLRSVDWFAYSSSLETNTLAADLDADTKKKSKVTQKRNSFLLVVAIPS